MMGQVQRLNGEEGYRKTGGIVTHSFAVALEAMSQIREELAGNRKTDMGAGEQELVREMRENWQVAVGDGAWCARLDELFGDAGGVGGMDMDIKCQHGFLSHTARQAGIELQRLILESRSRDLGKDL
jgi:hypothetical protein